MLGRAVPGIHTGTGRENALLAAVAPEVPAFEFGRTLGSGGAQSVLSADGARAFARRLTDRCRGLEASRDAAWNGLGLVGHQGRCALAETVLIGVAAWNSEQQTVEVIVAGPADAATEPLVGRGEEAQVPVRAIRAAGARDAPVDAGVVLARKPGDAVIRVVATGLAAQATTYARLTRVGRVFAVRVLLAGTASGHEAARKIAASGWQADLADRAGIVQVAQLLQVGAGGAEDAGVAPGPTAVG